MSDALRCPVCSCAASLHNRTRDRGCSAHPAFPAPSVFQGAKRHANLGRIAPRERSDIFSCRHPRKRVIQYPRDGNDEIDRPRRLDHPPSRVTTTVCVARRHLHYCKRSAAMTEDPAEAIHDNCVLGSATTLNCLSTSISIFCSPIGLYCGTEVGSGSSPTKASRSPHLVSRGHRGRRVVPAAGPRGMIWRTASAGRPQKSKLRVLPSLAMRRGRRKTASRRISAGRNSISIRRKSIWPWRMPTWR